MRRLRRLAAYLWAAPCSLLGLLLALPLLLCGARASRQHGALEIALWPDDKVRRLPFAAITFGHVIIGQNRLLLARLRAHEQVHVRQYQRWGVLFLLAYPAAACGCGCAASGRTGTTRSRWKRAGWETGNGTDAAAKLGRKTKAPRGRGHSAAGGIGSAFAEVIRRQPVVRIQRMPAGQHLAMVKTRPDRAADKGQHATEQRKNKE